MLSACPIYTFHKPSYFKRSRIFVSGINDQIQMDLFDISKFSRYIDWRWVRIENLARGHMEIAWHRSLTPLLKVDDAGLNEHLGECKESRKVGMLSPHVDWRFIRISTKHRRTSKSRFSILTHRQSMSLGNHTEIWKYPAEKSQTTAKIRQRDSVFLLTNHSSKIFVMFSVGRIGLL